ncbi:MAG: prepilin-type N-terminal cleavage/methylation domain-containing protein [Endomicrobia bacterium]|nr:prepilin-type N-terminal cleavage/methylation domain-containing protein [Endomicrobiia bacterium]
MKRDRGFSLFEVLIALMLTGMLVSVIGAMLVFGYTQLGRIIEINKGSADIMVFRSHIESRLQKITNQGFIIEDMVHTADAKFIEWWQYNSNTTIPILQNGLPNLYAVTPKAKSDWTGLVGRRVVFNSIDPRTGDVIRCIYEYNDTSREVRYKEYDVPLDSNGQESSLIIPPLTRLRIDAAILRKITVFQVGCSAQGIPGWEIYTSQTAAANMTTAEVAKDAYIRVFVRTENEDLRYRTNKSFISRSARRESSFWTPTSANKGTTYELDPTLVEFLSE